MPNTFIVSDTHFFHGKLTRQWALPGERCRPWDTAYDMNEALVANWNATVNPSDIVYHLGDVALGPIPQVLALLGRLNGHKRLVIGNHDSKDIRRGFEKVYAQRELADMLLTHIPIHPRSVTRWGSNVHGHLHFNTVGDPRYLCVSVEQTDYRPLTLDEVRERLRVQQMRA